MRYWLYGVDATSRKPRDPLFIEADAEDVARAQAMALGMIVEEVEAVRPRVERTAPQIPRGRWLQVSWLHLALTIALGGALLTLGVLLVAGKLEIRPVEQGIPKEPPAGPRVKRVKEAEKFFDLAGRRAFCFQYEGVWLDCWIEAEIDGKTIRLAEILGDNLRATVAMGQNRGPGEKELADPPAWGEPSGRLVFAQLSEAGKESQEVWQLAIEGRARERKSNKEFMAGITRQVLPPQPKVARIVSWLSSDSESLSGGKEITLAYIRTGGEKAGQISRTLRLKCKAVK